VKMKKALSILLLLASAASVFAGCSSDADAGAVTEQQNTAAAADSQSDAQTTEPSEYKAPGIKYDGKTFRYMDYVTDDYFWQAATYSDIFAEEENGDPVKDSQYKRNTIIEEELDIKLDVHSVATVSRNTSGAEFKRLVLAGEDLIDVGFMFFNEIKSIFQEPSLTVNLYDVPTLDLDASWNNKNFRDEFTIDNSIYAMISDTNLFSNYATYVIYFNKQLTEDFSFGNFYDMVRDQKWTSEVMLSMSKQVATDINGDGKMGEEDRYGLPIQNSNISSFYTMSGGTITERKGDDIVPSLNNERNVKILETYVPFVADKTLNANTSSFTGYSNTFYELFIPMFKDNRIMFYFSQLLVSYELRAMESDFGIIPFPKFDEIQENYITESANSWATVYAVPATNSTLDFTGNVLNALGYYSQQYVTPAYIDTTVMNKAIRDDDSAEMLEIIFSSRDYDIARLYGWGSVGSMFSGFVASGTVDFASKYAAIEAKFISDIEATMEKIKG